MSPQAVIDAAISALLSICPDDAPPVPIYAERIPQNFARPCFFVSAQQSEKPLMVERALRQIDLTILRYPAPNEDARAAGACAADILTLALEWLDVENRPRRAASIQHSIRDEDQALVMNLRFDFHILKHREPTKMQQLLHDEKVR